MKSIVVFAPILAISSITHAGLLATADVTPSAASPSGFHYDIGVHNTGTTTIGTLWFGWVPGADLMPGLPTNLHFPAGWTAGVTGSGQSFDEYAVEFHALSAAAFLPAGAALTGFGFDSPSSPAILTGPSPVTSTLIAIHSFVYIGQPETDPGYSFDPHIVPAPAAFSALALAALTAARRRRTT